MKTPQIAATERVSILAIIMQALADFHGLWMFILGGQERYSIPEYLPIYRKGVQDALNLVGIN